MADLLCPIRGCARTLELHVEQSYPLDGFDGGPIAQSWVVRCEENDHVCLTSYEYLEAARDQEDKAVEEAVQAGASAAAVREAEDAVLCLWWHDGGYGDDCDQPFPTPVRLAALLRTRGATDG